MSRLRRRRGGGVPAVWRGVDGHGLVLPAMNKHIDLPDLQSLIVSGVAGNNRQSLHVSGGLADVVVVVGGGELARHSTIEQTRLSSLLGHEYAQRVGCRSNLVVFLFVEGGWFAIDCNGRHCSANVPKRLCLGEDVFSIRDPSSGATEVHPIHHLIRRASNTSPIRRASNTSPIRRHPIHHLYEGIRYITYTRASNTSANQYEGIQHITYTKASNTSPIRRHPIHHLYEGIQYITYTKASDTSPIRRHPIRHLYEGI